MIDRAFVKTSHGRVHYREYGEGPPLMLLHQTADSSLAFEPLMPGLTGHRLLAPDTLGYGDSDAPPHLYSMKEFGDSVAAFLDALGVEKTAVMGNHTGASIAVELAAGHPDRVTALIAVGLAYYESPERKAKLAQYAVPFEVKEDGSHLMQAWAKVRRRGSSAPLELVERSTVDMLKSPAPLAAYQAVFSYDMAPRLPRVKCPALISAGESDQLNACSEPAARLMPNAKTHTFSNDNGYLIDAGNKPFVSTILDFLAANGV